MVVTAVTMVLVTSTTSKDGGGGDEVDMVTGRRWLWWPTCEVGGAAAGVDSWRWGGHGGDKGGVSMGGYGGGSEGDRVVVVGCRGGVAAGLMTVA
ncbi:hypothetical protein Tco_1456810 [Tanacetum coccineum]